MGLEIVDVAEAARHKAAWRRLYHGYASFYGRPATPDAVFETVWAWLNDPAHEMEGVLALEDGEPVGLAHFRRQPRPSYGEDMGYLDDLFVEPGVRGAGIGRALIAHVAEVARARGWAIVRWTTADDNYRARGLYDQLAKKTSWNLYEMVV